MNAILNNIETPPVHSYYKWLCYSDFCDSVLAVVF